MLTIIRLTEDIVAEVQRRGCGPLETYIFTLRLKMWPVFQKLMAEHVDGLKKFAEGFKLSTPVPSDLISIIAKDPAK